MSREGWPRGQTGLNGFAGVGLCIANDWEHSSHDMVGCLPKLHRTQFSVYCTGWPLQQHILPAKLSPYQMHWAAGSVCQTLAHFVALRWLGALPVTTCLVALLVSLQDCVPQGCTGRTAGIYVSYGDWAHTQSYMLGALPAAQVVRRAPATSQCNCL